MTNREKQIFYICNKKQCKKCNPECNHTTNIEFSKNYKTIPSIDEFMRFRRIENILFEVEEET